MSAEPRARAHPAVRSVRRATLAGLSTVAVITAWACSPVGAQGLVAAQSPLLDGRDHVGTRSFVDLPEDVQAGVDARLAEAADRGMDVGRVHLSWNELEPTLGTYDLVPLDEQLAELAELGLRPMVTIGVTDVETYSVPRDLMDPADGTKLRPGLALDDPEVIGRFMALYDVIEVRLREHGMWLLSLANEPNVLLGDKSPADLAAEAGAMERFIVAVGSHVHVSDPYVPISVSIAQGGFARQPFIEDLVAAGDVATFNYSCLDWTTFELPARDQVPLDLAVMEAQAGDRPVVIQELSCASGHQDQPSFIRSTPELQAAWFEAVWSAMAGSDQLRAAFVLDTLDWPDDLSRMFTDPLRDEGLPEIADRYHEFLRTWGLLDEDGSPKPAWDSFLRMVARPD